jgi:hypothetical protein
MPARPPVRVLCTEGLVTRQRHGGRRHGDAHNGARIFPGLPHPRKDCLDSPSGESATLASLRGGVWGSLRPRALLPGGPHHPRRDFRAFRPEPARMNASLEQVGNNGCCRRPMGEVYLLACWPEAMAPPGSQDWEESAVAFPVKFIWFNGSS